MTFKTIKQVLIFVFVLIISWYGMMIVHEFGHCVGCFISGGTIEKIKVPLLGFSYTSMINNPHPLAVAWAGPVTGAFLPCILLLLKARLSGKIQQAVLFFCGFCLIANGVYIGLGALYRVGDSQVLLIYGAPVWQLLLFSLVTSIVGLFVWHKTGPLRKWFE